MNSEANLLALVSLAVDVSHLVTDSVFLICWKESWNLPLAQNAADGFQEYLLLDLRKKWLTLKLQYYCKQINLISQSSILSLSQTLNILKLHSLLLGVYKSTNVEENDVGLT